MMRVPLDASNNLILSCSPRPQGNCDEAARIFFEEGQADAAGNGITWLRDFSIAGCTGCGACERWACSRVAAESTSALVPQQNSQYLGCPLSLRDDSPHMLHVLANAGEVCLIAPIYFYHLPSQLKALLDRTQPFWNLRQRGLQLFRHERRCKVILIGARSRGDNLFKGSLLTLKYSLAPLGLRIYEPLLLYGLEGETDLSEDKAKSRQVRAYAKG